MSTTNDIVLRPRFQMEFNTSSQMLLTAFEIAKDEQKDYVITRIDDHVFIKLPKHKQHFWSPQLHLEINTTEKNTSKLYGLFGPNPTIWTLFMFLHFVVAGFFIASVVWAYSNWSLKSSYALQIGLMLLMIVIWFALYFAGRLGRVSSKDEMHHLYNFMNSVLKKASEKIK
ncbi:GTP-binding protein [uncultured Psychroserpens sp.]|uniref:GTP-binding protein n=1 Tax=uncultured Psychroserpens sp. TaxID=255436 RepID=UPI00262A0E5F|nr:GTP-binding protein [uncultured Psychroserpens sp.]